MFIVFRHVNGVTLFLTAEGFWSDRLRLAHRHSSEFDADARAAVHAAAVMSVEEASAIFVDF